MELLETMRADGGTVPLLERHLDRMARAASDLGYPFSRSRLREDVEATISGDERALRVRMTVDGRGRVDIGVVDLARVPPISTVAVVPWPAAQYRERSRYKTTDRAAYDAAIDSALSAGADEALLIEESGELVEATRANIWLRRGSKLLTPPLATCGLPGIMRATILETVPGAAVARLTMDDLERADEILLSNAVRGLFRVAVK